MRVDGFRDASPCVTQNHLDAGVIDPGRVEQAGQRVAALVGRVVHTDGGQHSVETAAKAVVGGRLADVLSGFSDFQKREYLPGYGDPADACLRLAVPDVQVPLTEFDVSRTQGQILPDAEPRVYEYQHILDCIALGRTPQPVNLPDGKRPLFVDGNVLVYLDVSGVIGGGYFPLDGVLEKLTHEHPALLLGRVAGHLTDVVHGGLQVQVLQPAHGLIVQA